MKFKNSNPLGAAIFMSFAGFGLFSIWTEWSQSPHQAYQRVTGSVLSHSIAVDKVLWIGREAAPLRLTSTVLLDGREIRVTDTFESSEKAWAAALARPPESDTVSNRNLSIYCRIFRYRPVATVSFALKVLG